MALNIDKKRSIGQASKEIGVQEYVIRYWETQFGDYIKPTIGSGNRRYFFDKDIKILKFIKTHLHDKGYTIKGLQNLLKNENIDLSYNSEVVENNVNIGLQTNICDSDKNIVNNKSFELNNVGNITSIDFNLKRDMKIFRGKLNNFYEKLKSI